VDGRPARVITPGGLDILTRLLEINETDNCTTGHKELGFLLDRWDKGCGEVLYGHIGTNICNALRTQRLWTSKTVMIVNKASLVDVQTLAEANNLTNVPRSRSPDSPVLFGGLPVVVFMVDFLKFLPVTTLPLWRQLGDDYGDVLAKDVDLEKVQRSIIVTSNSSCHRLNQLHLILRRSSGGLTTKEGRDRRGVVKQQFWILR